MHHSAFDLSIASRDPGHEQNSAMNVIARVDQMLAGTALTEERFTKPVDVDNEEIVVNSLETLNQRHRR